MSYLLEQSKENDVINKENEQKIENLAQENKYYKEEYEKLEESLNELEKNFEISIKDAIIKQETIDNLENINSQLSLTCKTLEENIEKYIENEKYLRKEIKELFKRVGQRKSEKDSGSLSSNSETIIHNDESLIKDQRISLKSLPIDEEENTNAGLIFDTLEAEQNNSNLFESITTESYLQSHVPTETISQIENLAFLRECMKKKYGVLYENDTLLISISLTVEENTGKGEITFENKSKFNLTMIRTKLYANPLDGLLISINTEFTEFLLKDNAMPIYLVFQCMSIFQVFPYLKASYFLEGKKYRIINVLPIAYTLFCKKPNIDFIKEWDNIEEFRETVSKTDIDNIKKVTRNLLFNRNFDYSYIEGNGVIIATRSPIGLVLAVIMHRDSQIFIQVKSSDQNLRDLLNSLIITQLLPGH